MALEILGIIFITIIVMSIAIYINTADLIEIEKKAYKAERNLENSLAEVNQQIPILISQITRTNGGTKEYSNLTMKLNNLISLRKTLEDILFNQPKTKNCSPQTNNYHNIDTMNMINDKLEEINTNTLYGSDHPNNIFKGDIN
jgi:hypothetical protein